jgi:hypothetical protein
MFEMKKEKVLVDLKGRRSVLIEKTTSTRSTKRDFHEGRVRTGAK